MLKGIQNIFSKSNVVMQVPVEARYNESEEVHLRTEVGDSREKAFRDDDSVLPQASDDLNTNQFRGNLSIQQDFFSKGSPIIDNIKAISERVAESAKLRRGGITGEIRSNSRLKMKRCLYAVWIVCLFNKIGDNIKLYGTSTNLYKLSFRRKKAVQKALFPLKDTKQLNQSPESVDESYKGCIIPPNSTMLFIWNLFIALIIAYVITVIPYNMAFPSDSTIKNAVEEWMNLIFLVDIIFGFNTAFVDKEGHLIRSRGSIALRYLKGLFFVDLITCIPVSLFFESENTNAGKFLMVLKIPRLVKIVKITKIIKLKDLFKESSFSYFVRINGGLIRVVILALVTLVTLHLTACMWCFIGLNGGEEYNTWISRAGIEDRPEFEIYMRSFYFCFVILTTVGYGDITPFTTRKI